MQNLRILSTLFLFFTPLTMVSMGCDVGDAKSDSFALRCAQPLQALGEAPGIDELQDAAAELQALECSDLSNEEEVSFRRKMSDNCGCYENVCVCVCGNGGSCQQSGSVWYCGC